MSHKRRSNKKIPEERNKAKTETLRAEIRALRKQVAQLQKENQKLRYRDDNIKEYIEEYEQFQVQTEIEEAIPRCPKCKSHHITILPKLRGDIDYFVCSACSGRGPIK